MVKASGVRSFSAGALVAQRRRLGLSQEALARRSGIATVTVAKLEERRIVDPKGSTLAKLAQGLGCRVDSLFSGSPTARNAKVHGELLDE